MGYELKLATPECVSLLAKNIRDVDALELRLSSGETAATALERALVVSRDPLSCYYDGRILAMFGVGEHTFLSTEGSPWLIGSNEMSHHPKEVLRKSKAFVQDWSEKYNLLSNYVWVYNFPAITWLKWLGFTVHPPEPYGKYGAMFHKFTLGGQDV